MRLYQNFFARATEDVDLLKIIPGNLHGIPRICTHHVGNDETNNCFNGQQISHTIFPDQGNSTVFVERMRLRVAVQL